MTKRAGKARGSSGGRSAGAAHVRNVIKAAISGEFHRRLKDEGYARSGHTWRLCGEQAVRLVNVQSSTWNSPDRGSLTINLGIYDYALQRLAEKASWWPPPDGKLPVEHNCAIRTRIGTLMDLPGDRVDYWWDVTSKTDPSKLERELVAVLERYALAWLTKALDYKYAMRHSEARPGTHAGVLIQKLLNGKKVTE
jgi:hypothetical protein